MYIHIYELTKWVTQDPVATVLSVCFMYEYVSAGKYTY